MGKIFKEIKKGVAWVLGLENTSNIEHMFEVKIAIIY